MGFPKWRKAFGLYVRVARLTAFGAVVGVLLALMGVRSVYASAAESMFQASRPGLEAAGALDRASYAVRLNGERLVVASSSTDESVRVVLDQAEGDCRSHAGGLQGDVARLPKVALAKLGAMVFGTLRLEDEQEGFVACVLRDDDDGVLGIAHDFRAFAEDGNLAKLGRLHYVAAKRRPGSRSTHVLNHWTEGSFRLKRMFAKEGDAVGADMAGVPRPERSRRILDASIEGSPFGARVYEAPDPPEVVLGHYDQELQDSGWAKIPLPPERLGTMRTFDRNGTMLFVSAASTDKGRDRTVVSLAAMPARWGSMP